MSALTLLSLIGLTVVFFYKFKNLQKRIDHLENQIRPNDPAQQDAPVRDDTAEPSQPVEGKALTAPLENQPVRKPIFPKASDVPPEDAQSIPALAHAKGTEPSPKKDNAAGKYVESLLHSIMSNWVLWVSALSLALGGVFIVQYGIEKGYFGPIARVIAAIGFGLILLVAAQWLRTKQDPDDDTWFNVPATLATGGIASMFAGVVAAHTLYDLTSPLIGFLSMACVAWLAMLFGLIHGPILAIIGLLGAFFSPLLVESETTDPMMYLYFLLVLTASLFVERYQRWIWLSALGVAAALFWGFLLHTALPEVAVAPLYFGAIVLITASIPAFGFLPKSQSPAWVSVSSFKEVSTQYPTLLAVITAIAAAVLITLTTHTSLEHWRLAVIVFFGLTAFSIYGMKASQNLDQLAGIFGLSLITTIGLIGFIGLSNTSHLSQPPTTDYYILLKSYFPFATLSLLALMALFFGATIWRTSGSTRPGYWVLLTVSLSLLGFVILYAQWQRSDVLSRGNWGLCCLGLAGYFAALAALYHRQGNQPQLGADILTNGALLALGYCAWITLPTEQKAIAYAALCVIAYLCQPRFSFRYTQFTSLFFSALTLKQLIIWPGILWALDANLIPMLLVFGIVIAIMFLAFNHASIRNLSAPVIQFETAGLAIAAVLICVLIARLFDTQSLLTLCGLYSSVAGIFALIQYRRAERLSDFTYLRKIFGNSYLTIGAAILLLGLSVASPLFKNWFVHNEITGFFPVDSLTIGYGLPALVILAHRFSAKIPQLLNAKTAKIVSSGLLLWVVTLEIRHFWHGPDLSIPIIFKPELYSYTLMLLALTITTFIGSIIRHDAPMRHIGLIMAGVTAIKVFFWDMSGLEGLSRASAFIGLGLILAGIAWLHQRFPVGDKTTDKS